ncbi:MAG: DNA translocase FtsK [Erysipelotrichaceae bacterium]|nr:DNA translocase FtsK [Erysipelotrichaceae bacterium]
MKDTSSKVIDKARKQRDLLSEERKNRHYRQEEEKLRRHIEEEEKRKERRKATVPSSTRAEQLPLEENRSRFTRDFFIDDNRTQTAVKDADTKKEGDTDTKTVRKISKTASIKKNGRYKLPPLSLLEESSSRRSNINSRSAEVKGHRLIEVLANFGIDAELVNTHIGPSVTKFEIRPDSNIKIDKILNIQNNLKMELAAKDIRIEAPIPGRNAVGVEIPNAEMQSVRMCELMKAIPAKLQNSKLLFALGKDLMGKPVYCELNKMPHLLIAGATGSGKSVCMNTIICSLLLRTHPDEVKLVLVDPKKVEFSPYHDIPHLLWPVITESDKAAMLLKRLVVIMEERYETFSNAAVRDIASYNEYVERHNNELKEGEAALERMPFIVVIIDELADLMAVAKNDVQSSIQRFTQLARACGMHMIVATQRPSTDVITGLIKSNIPSRISFAVASSIDSRTILDCTGADKLLGNGDMLYLPQGESAPSRIQGAFVSDSEIRKITDCTKEQASPQYDDAYYALEQNGDGAFAFSAEGGNQKDPLYDQVVEFVREKQKASTSLLQRRFGIGYNRSARIIDELESSGIIGPSNGSKPREVYIKDDE